jgi:hypothetical protein
LGQPCQAIKELKLLSRGAKRHPWTLAVLAAVTYAARSFA